MTSRPEPPLIADERATLTGFLDFQRATLEWKCSGLTPEQLAVRGVPPSPISLLGLVRHMSDVERGWFRMFAGSPLPTRYYGPRDPDGDFDNAVGTAAGVDEAFTNWHDEIAHAREVVAGSSLDDTAVRPRDGLEFSLRWILVHMIEEYARHAGHADFLRERLDGAVGE